MGTPNFPCFKLNEGNSGKIPVQTIFPKLDEEGKIILELEKISKMRIKQLRNRAITEYFIKWKNPLVKYLTWEIEFLI